MVGQLMYLQLGERPASPTSMAAKPHCGRSLRELAASMPRGGDPARNATPSPAGGSAMKEVR